MYLWKYYWFNKKKKSFEKKNWRKTRKNFIRTSERLVMSSRRKEKKKLKYEIWVMWRLDKKWNFNARMINQRGGLFLFIIRVIASMSGLREALLCCFSMLQNLRCLFLLVSFRVFAPSAGRRQENNVINYPKILCFFNA